MAGQRLVGCQDACCCTGFDDARNRVGNRRLHVRMAGLPMWPIDADRSAGPMNTPSTPSVAAIASGCATTARFRPAPAGRPAHWRHAHTSGCGPSQKPVRRPCRGCLAADSAWHAPDRRPARAYRPSAPAASAPRSRYCLTSVVPMWPWPTGMRAIGCDADGAIACNWPRMLRKSLTCSPSISSQSRPGPGAQLGAVSVGGASQRPLQPVFGQRLLGRD